MLILCIGAWKRYDREGDVLKHPGNRPRKNFPLAMFANVLDSRSSVELLSAALYLSDEPQTCLKQDESLDNQAN